jgi:hypothetical protein
VKVVGLYLVRNEADIIETNLRHHFSTVIDEAIVLDNGSTDGTLELVAELRADLPIQLSSEVGPMFQSDRVTRLARLATLEGADWVLPIDADEFWVAPGTPFRDVLAETPTGVLSLFVEVVNFVQRRDVLVAEPGCLETMTRRPPRPIGPAEDTQRLVTAGEIGWVEGEYTPKSVHRARPETFIPRGNHCTGIEGGAPTDRIVCLHGSIRARSLLASKLDHGRRAIEEGSPPGAAWHVKRWWELARAHAFDREWEALSYEDGAITVGSRRRVLEADNRLSDAAHAVMPRLRLTTPSAGRGPIDELEPTVGAYALALDTVPGWFDLLDLRVLAELDRVQRGRGFTGDLFEMGAGYGKSAILLGHLARRPVERLTVCDVFEHADLIDAESWPPHNHWFAGLTQGAFVEQYTRFHDDVPEIIVGLSETIDAGARRGTCRLVHVDGGHSYGTVRADGASARTLLGPGGVVAFDDISTAHRPGVALAVWELVLGGGLTPFCLTQQKLYGTWDSGDATGTGAVDWPAVVDAWVAREPDLGSEIHTLAGWPVRRLFAMPRHAGTLDDLVAVPDREELDARLAQGAATP